MRKLPSFLMITFLIIFSQTSFATVHTILVGQGGLTFSPSSITTVVVGDTIHWSWISGSHTCTSVTIPATATSWNNAMTSSANDFDYKVTVAGTYDYQCNPHSSLGMKGSFLAQDVVTGINMSSTIYNTMTVAPNPSTDQIQLTFNSDESFTGSLMIFDATGNLEKEEKVKVKSGDNSVVVNVARLTKGAHILNLVNGGTSLVARRFIKE